MRASESFGTLAGMSLPDRRSLHAPQAASDSPAPAGWEASLELAFTRRDAATLLTRRRHSGPLRVQKALYPEGERVCHVILLHPPAGIAGGDRLEIRMDIGSQAHALATTPGAGKWYRSNGPEASLTQHIGVASGGVCEWFPQESIVFNGAVGAVATRVSLQGDGLFMGFDMICFGRTASGERFHQGRFAMDWTVEHDGQPLWLERAALTGSHPLLTSPIGLAGQPVCGTWIAAGGRLSGASRAAQDAGASLLAACRDVPVPAGEGAVTLLPGLLLGRWRGASAEAGRAWFSALWASARPLLTDLPARTPRIWNT